MPAFRRTLPLALAMLLTFVSGVSTAASHPPVGARVRIPSALEGRWTTATCERASADSLWLSLDRDGRTHAYARADVAGLEMAAGSRPSARKAAALGVVTGAVGGALVGWLAGRPGESEGGGSEGGGDRDDARFAPLPSSSATTTAPTPDNARFDAVEGAVIGGVVGGLLGALTGLAQEETAWTRVELTGAMPRTMRGAGLAMALRLHWR